MTSLGQNETCVPVDPSGRIGLGLFEELEDDEAADGVADEGELAVVRHVLLDEGDLVPHLAQDAVQRLVACGNQWQVSGESTLNKVLLV